MANASHTHHGIDYIEFVVTDMAQSQRFYAAAFGWEFNDYGPEYAGIRKQGGEAGGLCVGTTGSGGGPLVVLFSNDLVATLESVRSAGGTITKEFLFERVAEHGGGGSAAWVIGNNEFALGNIQVTDQL